MLIHPVEEKRFRRRAAITGGILVALFGWLLPSLGRLIFQGMQALTGITLRTYPKLALLLAATAAFAFGYGLLGIGCLFRRRFGPRVSGLHFAAISLVLSSIPSMVYPWCFACCEITSEAEGRAAVLGTAVFSTLGTWIGVLFLSGMAWVMAKGFEPEPPVPPDPRDAMV
jgi:hypothetical protein